MSDLLTRQRFQSLSRCLRLCRKHLMESEGRHAFSATSLFNILAAFSDPDRVDLDDWRGDFWLAERFSIQPRRIRLGRGRRFDLLVFFRASNAEIHSE